MGGVLRPQLTCTTSSRERCLCSPQGCSPRATSTCPQRPLTQVAEAAPAPAFSLAPILIHPEHLCPSLPIGERRMGGVRARPISSQMDTSSPALPTPHPGSTSAHATTAPAKDLDCLLLQPPRSHHLSELFASKSKNRVVKVTQRSGAGEFCWMLDGESSCASLKKKKKLCASQAQLK